MRVRWRQTARDHRALCRPGQPFNHFRLSTILPSGVFLFVAYPSNRYNGHMSKRLLLIIAMVLVPLGATADTATSPDAPAGLGPQTTSSNPGGSSADSAVLQPAGLSPLQSTTADSAGLIAPSSVLQAPATGGDALKVLAGEADGSPQGSAADATRFPWGWAGFVIIFGLIAAAGSIVWRDRRRYADSNQG